MLDTPCSDVVWRVIATHSIRQFPLHFPSRASPCAIAFQLDSTISNPVGNDSSESKWDVSFIPGVIFGRKRENFVQNVLLRGLDSTVRRRCMDWKLFIGLRRSFLTPSSERFMTRVENNSLWPPWTWMQLPFRTLSANYQSIRCHIPENSAYLNEAART